MVKLFVRSAAAALVIGVLIGIACIRPASAGESATNLPKPVVDEAPAKTSGQATTSYLKGPIAAAAKLKKSRSKPATKH